MNGQIFSQIQDKIISRDWEGELINGVCWAKSNVDKPGTFASTPEAYGMYYQWNRKNGVYGADLSDWDYCFASERYWESVNDPCPTGWRIPTVDELEVLLDELNVAYVCTSQNGISGGSFTDKITNNVIFLPFAGIMGKSSGVQGAGKSGYYTSSEQTTEFAGYANYLELSSWGGAITFLHHLNSAKMPVRCVADEKIDSVVSHDTVTISAKDLPYEWGDTTFLEGTKTGTYRISRRSCAYTDIAYLHLTIEQKCEKPCPGVLINGVCWAKSNVGEPGTFAATPESYGMLYQWNRKKGWSATEAVSGWDSSLPSGTCWDAANDPCPSGWRVPTIGEFDALLDNTNVTSIMASQNGVGGRKFTDNTTGNSIFLPGVYYRNSNDAISHSVNHGFYWSSSSFSSLLASSLNFNENNGGIIWPKHSGLAIRCVVGDPPDCGSIVTNISEIVCAKDLPYTWGDTIFDVGTESGTYSFQYVSTVTGNDSIVNLHLTVDECEMSCPGVLINGVCWAEYNVDEPGRFANPGKPYGMLYQWNRKKGWPAMTPESVSGWDSSLEPGDTWEPANDPCPVGWRMPTAEEMEKLFDKTKVSNIETGHNRVLSTRYTDIATGNMIFLPHANYRDEHGVTHNILRKEYWSGTNHWALWDDHIFRRQLYADGYSVRCVADENACDIVLTASENICKEALPYTWHDTTFREGTVTGEYRIQRTNPISKCDTIFYLYLTVDTLCGKPCKERGVFINGVCWAESNVDNPNTFADTPEAFGLLYQWNRKKGFPLKENIDPDDWYYNDSYVRWEAVNNPCPADWRIPTIGEIYTLLDELRVTREWVQQNGVYGLKFIDKFSSNAIFFPKAGSRYDFDLLTGGKDDGGYYWSTSKEYNEQAVYTFAFFDEKSIYTLPLGVKGHAYSVRCVAGRDTMGCGSIVTDTSVTVCTKDLPYEWGDTIFDVGTVSGTYSFQYVSVVTGCDSLVNLRLTVHASASSFFDAVCFGSSYDKHGFSLPVVYHDTVIYDTLQSVWGCDSVRTLYLTVNPEYNTPLCDTVCRGASYNRHGFSLSNVQKDDVHTLPLSSRAGCDSTLTLYLKVHPVYDTILYDTVCQGDAYHKHGLN
ncbi:MAG: hypothetical protein K2I47_02445, partial [Odoribacter sp.]|nr:hypothetical protein [Odoribacter sp.]